MEKENVFLKEWNDKQEKIIETKIFRWFKTHHLDTKDKNDFCRWSPNFKRISNELGFAYTSSGVCAGLFVNNTILYFDVEHKLHIYGFIVDEELNIYALVHDNYSEEYIVEL